jgi:hypothetical protein
VAAGEHGDGADGEIVLDRVEVVEDQPGLAVGVDRVRRAQQNQ